MISNLTKKNVAKKTGKGTKLKFLCTQGTPQGGRAQTDVYQALSITIIIYSSNTLDTKN